MKTEILTITLVCVLLGCSARAPDRFAQFGFLPAGSTLVVAGNAHGHAPMDCRYRQESTMSQKVPGAEYYYAVYCGQWNYPTGRFLLMPKRGDRDQWVEDSPWRSALDGRCAVARVEQAEFLGRRAILLPCNLLASGFGYFGLALQTDEFHVLVDGIAPNMAAIEQALSTTLGLPVTQTPSANTAVAWALRELNFSFTPDTLMEYHRAMSLGQYYNGIGNHARALVHYENAYDLQLQVNFENNGLATFVLLHRALEHSNLQQFDAADELFAQAENTRYRVHHQARFDVYNALHMANQGFFKEAGRLAKHALEDHFSTPRQFARRVPVSALRVQGESEDPELMLEGEPPPIADSVQGKYLGAAMSLRLGDTALSLEKLNEALALLDKAAQPPPLWRPTLLGLKGLVTEAGAQPDESYAARSDAHALLQELAPGELPEAEAMLALGRHHVMAAQRDEPGRVGALDLFDRAIAQAKLRNNRLYVHQLAPFFDSLTGASTDDTQALHRRYFDASQLVRGHLTERSIAQLAKQLDADPEVAELVRDYEGLHMAVELLQADELIALRHANFSGSEQALAAHARIRQERLSREAALFDKAVQLQAADTAYLQVAGRAAPLQEIEAQLRPGEAIVHLMPALDKTYYAYVKRALNGVVQYRVGSAPVTKAELERLVAKVRTDVRGVTRGTKLVDSRPPQASDAIAAGAELALSDPRFARLLPAHLRECLQHLVVTGHGPFLSLPMAMLRVPQAGCGGTGSGGLDWLGRHLQISRAPSISSFIHLRKMPASNAPEALLALGDFRKRAQDPRRTDTVYCRRETTGFETLKTEVTAISRLFDAPAPIAGEAFTLAAVQAAPLDNYRIVYFATHGVRPYENDCIAQPALVTSPVDGEYGYFTTQEIFKKRLNADLVVLSACNTADSNWERGESLNGLARAFIHQGARSVLVSHWQVDSDTTTVLMTELFKHLRAGATLGTAMSKAQMHLADSKQFSAPYYWAPFSIVGDAGRLILQDVAYPTEVSTFSAGS
ncbi:MAG: CHAT domain-containing protein [Pseudomonadota bacterium]